MEFDENHKPGGILGTGDLLIKENESIRGELRDGKLSDEERKKRLRKIEENEKQYRFRNIID